MQELRSPFPFIRLTASLTIVPKELEEKICEGSLVSLNFAGRKTWGVVWGVANSTEVPSDKLKTLSELRFEKPVFSSVRKQFVSELSENYFHPLGEVCEAALPGPLRSASKKLLEQASAAKKAKKAENFLELNEEQEKAVSSILESKTKQHLLWGVTGSGKTEVYLHLIREVLKQGKNAIVLVPEIALTPVFFSRFEKRFPGELAVFHSGQKPAALRKAWLSMFRGEKRIALGARSALFAPVDNVGLIIIDEEHDSSYKQEERLRYNARNEAIRLARLHDSKIVLGSATPSIESIYACRQGTSLMHKLEKRAAADSKLPSIEVCDLKLGMGQQNLDPTAVPNTEPDEEIFHRPESRETFFISPLLETALDDTLKNKKQAILFLNRRGLARHDFCTSCGYIAECKSCEVKLTPHHKKLLCHYCGFECAPPKICPSCSAPDSYKNVGVGTQSIVLAMERLFPKARVLRLDRDSISKVGELESTIAQFEQGEADILIGTQMVAKGHDFPNVTLVGVLLAELGLGVPDFRAEEKTLQLLLQVAGRSGRAKDPGRVIVQSFSPELRVLQFLLQYKGLSDLEAFLDAELMKRAALEYPPESQLIMLRLDSMHYGLVEKAADHVANALIRAAQGGYQVLGPVPSPLGKLKNRYRFQILLKTKKPAHLRAAINWVYNTWHKQKLEREYKTRLLVDVDPVQML